MESNIISGPPNLSGLKTQVSDHEIRMVASEAQAADHEVRLKFVEAQKVEPLHWIRRNWQTVIGIVVTNTAITALLLHFLR
jgi:hypothetical protein